MWRDPVGAVGVPGRKVLVGTDRYKPTDNGVTHLHFLLMNSPVRQVENQVFGVNGVGVVIIVTYD